MCVVNTGIRRSRSLLPSIEAQLLEVKTDSPRHFAKSWSVTDVCFHFLDFTASDLTGIGADDLTSPAGKANGKRLREISIPTCAAEQTINTQAVHSPKRSRLQAEFSLKPSHWSGKDTEEVLALIDVSSLHELLFHCLQRLRRLTWHLCRESNQEFLCTAKNLEAKLNEIDMSLSRISSVPELITLLMAMFLLLVGDEIFNKQRLDARQTQAVVSSRPDSTSQHPVHAQVDLLSCVTPVLAVVLQEVPHQAQDVFDCASRLLGDLGVPPGVEQLEATYSIRLPSSLKTIALDFDDTIFMHSLVPGMKVLFQVMDTHAALPQGVLKSMLQMSVPHRDFLCLLTQSMQAAGREVYVTSFGEEAWVGRAMQLLFGHLNLHDKLFCRRNVTSCHEIVDKNVWLTVLQHKSGCERHELLLVDDHRRNILRAKAFGFGGLQVDRNEGLHFNCWAQVALGHLSIVDKQPSFSFDDDECVPCNIDFDMLVAEESSYNQQTHPTFDEEVESHLRDWPESPFSAVRDGDFGRGAELLDSVADTRSDVGTTGEFSGSVIVRRSDEEEEPDPKGIFGMSRGLTIRVNARAGMNQSPFQSPNQSPNQSANPSPDQSPASIQVTLSDYSPHESPRECYGQNQSPMHRCSHDQRPLHCFSHGHGAVLHFRSLPQDLIPLSALESYREDARDALGGPVGRLVFRTKGWIKKKGMSMLHKLADHTVRLVHAVVTHTTVD